MGCADGHGRNSGDEAKIHVLFRECRFGGHGARHIHRGGCGCIPGCAGCAAVPLFTVWDGTALQANVALALDREYKRQAWVGPSGCWPRCHSAVEWISEQMRSLGMSVQLMHSVECGQDEQGGAHPLRPEQCVTVHGVLPAQRATPRKVSPLRPHAERVQRRSTLFVARPCAQEAVLLATHYMRVGHEQSAVSGLALLLSLARHLREQPWLARDVVFVAACGSIPAADRFGWGVIERYAMLTSGLRVRCRCHRRCCLPCHCALSGHPRTHPSPRRTGRAASCSPELTSPARWRTLPTLTCTAGVCCAARWCWTCLVRRAAGTACSAGRRAHAFPPQPTTAWTRWRCRLQASTVKCRTWTL